MARGTALADADAAKNPGRRPVLFGLAAMLGSTLLLLLMLEGFFRLAAPQDAALSVDTSIRMIEPAGLESPYAGDPDRGLVLRPDVRFINSAPEFSVTVQTNSDGYRAPEFGPLLDTGKPVVVVTGDSFVWGHGVEESGRAFDLVANSLDDHVWLNLGVPGTGTDQHLLHWRRHGGALKARLVVEVVYPNDLIDILQEFRYFPKPRFVLNGDGGLDLVPARESSRTVPRLLPVDRFLRNRSHLYAFFKGRLRSLRAAGEAKGRYDDVLMLYRKERPEALDSALRLLKAILSLYAAEVRATGAQFAVVVVPHKWEMQTSGRYVKDDWGRTVELMRLNPDEFDLWALDRGLKSWGAVENVPVLGLLEHLIRREAGDTWVYFPRDGHWTAAGNRIVAETFVSEFWPGLRPQPVEEGQ